MKSGLRLFGSAVQRARRHWSLLGAVCLLAVMVPLSSTASGDYLIHVWEAGDGLPENSVTSMAQTPEGYIWVGTLYGGLSRFDGVRFVTFTPQNTPELRDVEIENLSVDGQGRLWIATGNESITVRSDSVFRLVRKPRVNPRYHVQHVVDSSPTQVVFSALGPRLIRGTEFVGADTRKGTPGKTYHWEEIRLNPPMALFHSFVSDKQGAIWYLNRRQQLVRFSEGKFRTVRLPGTNPQPRIVSYVTDPQGNLWAATPRRIFKWEQGAFQDCTPAEGAPPSSIRYLTFSGDGGLWVCEDNRIRKIHGGQWVTTAARPERGTSVGLGLIEVASPKQQGDLRFFGDAQGGLWIVHYGHALWHIRPDGVTHRLTEAEGLPNTLISCWFQDREGNIWVGTRGRGFASIRERLFDVVTTTPDLKEKAVRSVSQDTEGAMWIGTVPGALVRQHSNGTFSVPLPEFTTRPIESVTVFPSPGGGVWIGSMYHGVMHWDQGTITRPFPAINLVNATARVLYSDTSGRLWIGSGAGLYLWHEGKFQKFGDAQGFVDGIGVGGIAEDKAGTIWIGSLPGDLWSFNQVGFTRYSPPAEFPPARIVSLLVEEEETLWAGTLGGGLLKFRDGQFVRYTTEDGLPDNNITQILDDGDRHLWVGTHVGIFQASKDDLHAFASGTLPKVPCKKFGKFDGLPAVDCPGGYQPAAWRANDGKLWFSTTRGVVTVDPQRVLLNERRPPVLIEELRVDGAIREIPGAKDLKIEPGRHYVQFRFTGLSFTAPEQVRFRWKLEGLEREWQEGGAQRMVGYGPLAPGNYVFRVLACNNHGVWNEQGAVLGFTVLPFFWETLWFKLSAGTGSLVALGLTVGLTVRRRQRREMEKLERRHDMERERSRIARDLHDDLGTSLTQIGMLSSLANHEQTSPGETRDFVTQIRTRAREMVVALDEIVWAVNPRNDSVGQLVTYLGSFAEEFFRCTPMRCRLEIPDDLPNVPLSAEVRHHLFLAVKEALNNVAKHATASQVCVQVEPIERGLVIRVEDDGQGLPSTALEQHGNGILNMQRRLEAIGGQFQLRSEPGRGTRVEFKLDYWHANGALRKPYHPQR